MMRLYLDDQLLSESGTTLGAALATANARAPGRLIVDVIADGRPVPVEHLDSPPTSNPYARELRVATADTAALGAAALREAASVLTASAPAHTRAGELIQEGRTPEALAELTNVLAAWDHIRRTSESCAVLPPVAKAAATTTAQGQGLPAASQELARHLTEIKRTLTAGDWSALADALLYDMGPLISRWTTLLNTLADKVESR